MLPNRPVDYSDSFQRCFHMTPRGTLIGDRFLYPQRLDGSVRLTWVLHHARTQRQAIARPGKQ